MTTTILSQRHKAPAASARGFTLVEVLIGATLGSFILLAVLSTFLFLGRSGANLRNYTDMETQARKALELFAEDTRQASAVSWTSLTSVLLTVNGNPILYSYDGSGNFTRAGGTGTSTLLTGITKFEFSAYGISGGALWTSSATSVPATANATTKQIQISLSAARKTQTVAAATNIVLSARYVLRNKRVTA